MLQTVYAQAADLGEAHRVVSTTVCIQTERITLKLHANYHINLLPAFGVDGTRCYRKYNKEECDMDNRCGIRNVVHVSS